MSHEEDNHIGLLFKALEKKHFVIIKKSSQIFPNSLQRKEYN